jgi:PAS domain S-box-containing protein
VVLRATWPGVLLLVGLIVTALIAAHTETLEFAAEERDFAIACGEMQAKILERLKTCEGILRAGAAFHSRSGPVTREEWQRFVALQQIDVFHPGIQGVGYARVFPRGELDRHLAEIRAEGFPMYHVRPAGEREVYSAIIFLEPFTNRNLRAFGYDMLSEPVRREAMLRARDQNAPALSGKVVLVQETGKDVQAGTLMYMPVFRPDRPTASPEERRAALIGWVYSPYRMADLMQGILAGRNFAADRRVHLAVFDGEKEIPAALLYASQAGEAGSAAPGSTQRRVQIVSAGRPWTLRFTRTSPPASPGVGNKVGLVVFSGTSSSLFLSWLLFSLLHTRSRARELAERLTTQLRESEERFRAIADYTVGWEAWFDRTGKLRWVNPGVERITGYSPAEALELPDFAGRMIAAEDRAAFAAVLAGAAEGDQGDNREFRCIRKDGTKYWLSVSWQPIFDRHGHALGLRFSGRDITELKRAETKLHRANWVVDQSSTSITITDANGIIEYVNSEFTKSTGYAREEAIGRNPRFLSSGLTPRSLYEDLWRTLLSGQNWHGEFQNRKKSGEIFWETAAISPLRDTEGHVTHFVCIKQDVTERKRLQLALTESLANFRTFFESITDMIFVGRPDGTVIYANQAVTQTLGYGQDELTAMHLLDVHPRDRRREAEDIFGAMFRGERASCPLPLVTKDGQLVPVDTRVWFGQWNGENCLFGVSKNLSAEQEAKQRFERLFRNNPCLMALSSLPDQRFYDVNDTFLQVLGLRAEEVIGKTAAELDLFPEAERHAAVAQQLLREGRVGNIELLVRRRDGTLLAGLFGGEVIRSHGKQFFLTVMNDISALKRMEAALKESNERLFLAAQAGGVGIWEYRVAERRLDWDDQMLRLHGITRAQFCGTTEAWQKGMVAEDRAKTDAAMLEALQGRKNFDTEFRVAWPDGSVRSIRAIAVVQRDAAGRPVRMIGTSWDISAQKRREAETAALLEKERQVSEMKTRFISVTSHEFRTPMTAAVASAELLTNHFDRLEAGKRRQLLDRIALSLGRLTGMLDEVLVLNRLEERRVEPVFTVVDLHRQLADLIEEARSGDRDAHRFELIAPAGSVMLQTDTNCLHHIMSNLLSNAGRYSPPGTVITVRLETTEEQVVVQVEDQGIGIPSADQLRVFEPFERGSNVGTIKGTGLGLNIVKRMTELLGGTVSIAPGGHRGARFHLILPRRGAVNPPPSP